MAYMGREATPGTIFTIISFFLLFVINLLTPIIKPLYFVKISRLGLTVEEELTIGLWGYCAQINGEPKKCTSTKIGFAFDPRRSLNPNLISGGLNKGLPGAVSTSLSYLVVVHIIALITLSIVSFVGVFAHKRKNRDKGLLRVAAQSSSVAFIFVLFAFIIDFILYNNEIVKPINKMVGTVYSAKFDNAYYLMIVCLISSGLATIGFLVGMQRNKSDDDKQSFQEEPNNESEQIPYIPQYGVYEEEEIRQHSPSPVNRPLPVGEYSNPPFLPGPQSNYSNPPFLPGPQPGVEYSNPPFLPGQPGVDYSNPSFLPGSQPGVEYSNPSFLPGPQPSVEYSNPSFLPGSQPGVEYSSPSIPFGPQPGSEYPYQSPMPYQGQGHSSPIRRTPAGADQFVYSHQSPHQSPHEPPSSSYPNAYNPYSSTSPQDGYPVPSNQPSYNDYTNPNPNIYQDQSKYHKPPGNYYAS
ncbi:4339_t:CDS:2 [Funneliformis geosporum]|uniref:3037_t:CDS:1 n=1 Tax=Funneliformis geosporum TaxID=1117311 RepID=A0A9W4SR68_9GLOM|nr:4339_t:CDS:2 [Funneliformis geosporum]CAI2178635.1 3037_t:CDS:2 [Funneliformis geosporum]